MGKRLTFAALLLFLVPAGAQAQTEASAGGFMGVHLDYRDHFFLFGADARVPIPSDRLVLDNLELNPRFTYRPMGGESLIEVNLNLVHNLVLANPGRFEPYVGIGGAITHWTYGNGFSDTKVGLTLLSGARYAMDGDSRLEPFFHAQYTITPGLDNQFALVVGARVKLQR